MRDILPSILQVVSPKDTFDAIVVGSGATGGWAAKKLTEAGMRVAVLEAKEKRQRAKRRAKNGLINYANVTLGLKELKDSNYCKTCAPRGRP